MAKVAKVESPAVGNTTDMSELPTNVEIQQRTLSEMLNSLAAEHRLLADQFDALALICPENMHVNARAALIVLLENYRVRGD